MTSGANDDDNRSSRRFFFGGRFEADSAPSRRRPCSSPASGPHSSDLRAKDASDTSRGARPAPRDRPPSRRTRGPASRPAASPPARAAAARQVYYRPPSVTWSVRRTAGAWPHNTAPWRRRSRGSACRRAPRCARGRARQVHARGGELSVGTAARSGYRLSRCQVGRDRLLRYSLVAAFRASKIGGATPRSSRVALKNRHLPSEPCGRRRGRGSSR